MRLQIILSFVLIILVSVTGVAFAAQLGAASEVRSFMFQGSMVRAQEIAKGLEQYYQKTGSWEGAESSLLSGGLGRELGRGPSMGHGGQGMMMGQRLRLADVQGKVILDTINPTPGEILSEDQIALAIPIKSGLKTVGYLLPESMMAFTASDEQFLVSRLTRAALIAGVIAGGLSLILALFLAYRLSRPVQALTQAAHLLAKGDFSQRVRARGDDELALLARTFNHMADSLQKAQENRRAMTADIAHELRTPLSVQLANLEALQDGIYPLTPENLEPILENNRLLSRLVDDLRTLALADAGQLELETTEIDLPSLVDRVVERFRRQAAANNIRIIQEDLVDCPPIQADPGRIEQILTNLLSNAMRHTPERGMIYLALTSTSSAIHLVIRDTGAGIPPEALPLVFERFYRADRGRSRSEGGSGLGLAIARQLAQLHGGSLTAGNHPESGAMFTLTLPLRAVESS